LFLLRLQEFGPPYRFDSNRKKISAWQPIGN
jgi:hypothetical protein